MDAYSEIAALVSSKKETLLSAILSVAIDNGKKLAIDLDLPFINYLKGSYDKYSKVKTLLYRNEPQYLYDFFVQNYVKFREKTIECNSANEILEYSHFNILLGSGGTGKSMMMKHFFLSEIKNKDLIPLFIELRTYSGGSLDDYLYKSLSNLGFSLEQKYFQYALRTGAFLLLLDGYDEVADNKKTEFYRELEQFCDRYSKNWYIVSSRQNESFIGWQRFSIFNILPLTIDQAKELIEKIDYNQELKEKFLAEMNSLYKKHESFASNPLLLNILLMTYDNFAEIPEKRHVFYSNAFDTLYAVHDATKGGFKRYLKCELSSDLFKKVFAEFCFVSYIQDKIEFSQDNLYKMLECGKNYKANFNSEAYIQDLQNAVCLIYKEGNTYLFTHRSFQEYFAALYLRNLNDDQQKQACIHLLNSKSPSINADSVFEMLMDMNQERFECNFMLPVLREMESILPTVFEDELQRRFVGYVDSVEFITQNSLWSSAVREFDWNYAFPLYLQRNIVICLVKFKELRYSRLLNFIYTHYKMQKQISKRFKSLRQYLEKPYSAEDVQRDRTLFKIVMQTHLGQILKASIGLLGEIETRRELNRDKFMELLQSYHTQQS